jgi:hypothetical protein
LRAAAILPLMFLLALGACRTAPAGEPRRAVVEIAEEPEWRSSASPADVGRLDRLDGAWEAALGEARSRGFSRQIAAEGRLLQRDAALPRPAPSPGSYMCKVIKLGSQTPRGRAFTAYKPFFCHVGVAGDQLSITKQTGSQRPGGYLWDDADPQRLIFLGSVALGNEDAPLAYGEDSSRDMSGVFERVGPFRYRLVVPWPQTESKLDVFELIPAPVQRDE